MRTLLFDIDGTLLLTNGGGSGALKLAIEDEFGVGSACTDVDYSGRTDRSLLPELLERNGIPSDDEHIERLGRRYTELLPEVLSDRGGRVLPGTVELLRRLTDETDLRCYVMTGNLKATATQKLHHFRLLDYFRGVFGGDHDTLRQGLAKRTASTIRQRYGESASDDMVVIGDTPADVQCGHAIGAKVVAVCTGFHDRDALQAESPMSVHDDFSNVDHIFDLLVDSSG